MSTDMIVGRAVRLIGGLPGEYVEFTKRGIYRIDLGSPCPSECHYRVSTSNGLGELDIWIRGLESLITQCIYYIAGDDLEICIGGDSGERPTKLQRDDERLWCLMTLKRSEPPKRRKSGLEPPLLKPGSLIPDAFLDEG